MTQGAKTFWKWTAFVVLSAYVVVMTFWATQKAHSTPCPGVKVIVDGDSRTVSPEAVLGQIRIFRDFKGVPVSDIDTRKVEAHLARFNNFEDVECAIAADGALLVKVVPLVPELRVFSRRGSYYINKDGKHIDANAAFYVDVPIVSGNFNSSFRPTALLPLTRYLRSDSLLKSYFPMIFAESPDNIILIPGVRGHVVNIGDVNSLPDKFGRLMTMYRKVLPYKGWNTYDTISVKFKNMIVATRRDKTIRQHGTENLEGDEIEEQTLALETSSAPAQQENSNLKPSAPAQ